MNKLLIVAKRMAIITFLITNVNNTIYSHTTPESESTFNAAIPRFSDQDIKDRLENISSVMDLNYTNEVGRRIREYTVNYRKAGELILGRVDLYFPLFEKEIQKRNLPEELKFVAVVESNLEPTAKSKSGALGLWQFIKSTGREKGLKMNNYVDERRDPEKSTKAALDYLSELYNRFDDWTLAIAAYNCGPGNVRKAIRRGNSKNYWDIRKHLPRETQKYVPRIIAAMYLMQYYHYHNLSPTMMDKDMIHTIKINNNQDHNFEKLAVDLSIDYSKLRSLNPQFKTKHLPTKSDNYMLVLPVSKYETYLKNYDTLSYSKLMDKRKTDARQLVVKERQKMRKRRIPEIQALDVLVPHVVFSSDAQASVNISY